MNKAITFLESVFTEYTEIFKGGLNKPMLEQLELMKTGSIIFTQRFEKLHKLYSQPFKPELIAELFHDWITSYRTNKWKFSFTNRSSDYVDLPNPNDPANGDCITYESKGGECNFIIPKTLNDFISDCQRAGIELNWKPEILIKYFNQQENANKKPIIFSVFNKPESEGKK